MCRDNGRIGIKFTPNHIFHLSLRQVNFNRKAKFFWDLLKSSFIPCSVWLFLLKCQKWIHLDVKWATRSYYRLIEVSNRKNHIEVDVSDAKIHRKTVCNHTGSVQCQYVQEITVRMEWKKDSEDTEYCSVIQHVQKLRYVMIQKQRINTSRLLHFFFMLAEHIFFQQKIAKRISIKNHLLREGYIALYTWQNWLLKQIIMLPPPSLLLHSSQPLNIRLLVPNSSLVHQSVT